MLDELVIRKTGRLPRPDGPPGDGTGRALPDVVAELTDLMPD